MKKIFLVTAALCMLTAQGQECDCESTFNWVKKTFEENDAGFLYVLQNKGEEAYKQHNIEFNQVVKSVSNPDQCRAVIREWLSFFRSGHLSFNRINVSEDKSANTEPTETEIIQMYKDWKVLKVDMNNFKKYIDSKKKVEFEGIWTNGPYEIGIKKVKDKYIGFIIQADGIYWKEGQIKLEIHEDSSSTYYMRDHSAENFNATELLGDNFLEMGFVTLKRKYPIPTKDDSAERYIKVINAEKPYLESIGKETLLLRIPRFSGSHKKNIDSVIHANMNKILKTKNLIIDLRNNGGGSDRSFQELIPLLYTNPIRSVGVEFLSTPLNNKRMMDFINDPKYDFNDKEKKWAKQSHKKLSRRINEFVNLKETKTTITKLDVIHDFPKNIGIIINENNASTTEQFLLLAKQSKKVKLFGTTTQGLLDISNMYFVKSPCEDFELGYGLSKSMRIPEMTVDNKGIQPDYYIDSEVPKHKWIDYVISTFND